MRRFIISSLVLLWLCTPALAVQRMGIAAGTVRIPPKGSGTLSSRCLDEHWAAPTTSTRYTKSLSGNPEDITVVIDGVDTISVERAIREGKVSITGYDEPGGRWSVSGRSYTIGEVRVNNLTDKPIVVRVRRFTPIGTAEHESFDYDVSELAGLDQDELWRRQPGEAKRQREEAEEEEKRKRTGARVVVLGDQYKNSIGMEFRLIPGGSFWMGSPRNEDDRESDESLVEVNLTAPFWMGVAEVTQEQYQAVMGTNPSNFKGSKRPVETVNWYDAVEYCNKLSDREGLTRCYSGSGSNITCNWSADGYRLPTEAEWEYACRAGTTTEYNTGSGSSALDRAGWYSSNSGSQTHDVEQKAANAWGLYDMHGNVWEWCWDWYGSYSSGSQTDPRGPSTGSSRVKRGGSWYFNAQICRSADRDYFDPGYGDSNYGFRVVRAPGQR